MKGSKSPLMFAVVAGLGLLGCYSNAARAEDASAGTEAPAPRSPLRVERFDYQDGGSGAGKVTIAGIAVPNSDLYLYFDDQPLARVMPDEGGKWSVESELKLEDGRHTLRAEQYDPVTRMLAARAMISIQRGGEAPAGAPKTP